MSVLRGIWRSLFVTGVVTNLHGCGSSTNTIGNPIPSPAPMPKTLLTTSQTPRESAVNQARLAPPTEQQAPVSALETMNLPPYSLERDVESGALKLSFADLNLQTLLGITTVTEEETKRLPHGLKALDGKQVRISGYMYPTFEESGFDRFILDASGRLMNFGSTPKAYELLAVELVPGTTTRYPTTFQPIEVIGTFRLDPIFEDGKVAGLYFLENAAVVNRIATSTPP